MSIVPNSSDDVFFRMTSQVQILWDGFLDARWAEKDGHVAVMSSSRICPEILDAKTGSVLSIFKSPSPQLWHMIWSPCGKYIVGVGYDKRIRLWRVDTGILELSFYHEDFVHDLAWTFDSQHIIFSCSNGLYLWKKGTDHADAIDTRNKKAYDLAVNPVNDRFVYVCKGNELNLTSVTTADACVSCICLADPIECLAWSTDGKYMAVSMRGSTKTTTARIEIIRFTEPEEAPIVIPVAASHICWSPDSCFIASAHGCTISTHNVKTKATYGLMTLPYEITKISWSSDESRIFVIANDCYLYIYSISRQSITPKT